MFKSSFKEGDTVLAGRDLSKTEEYYNINGKMLDLARFLIPMRIRYVTSTSINAGNEQYGYWTWHPSDLQLAEKTGFAKFLALQDKIALDVSGNRG